MSHRRSGEAARRFEPPDLSRLLVESVEDASIFALDPTGHVLTWNAGAQRSLGYAADEILGRHYSVFYPSEDIVADLPAAGLRVAATAGRFEQEGWRVRKDGSRLWVSSVITALRDPAGGLIGFANVTRDLTERRRADEALRDSEARLRGAFDHAATGMAIANPAGRWIRVNPALSEILGYSEPELLSISFPAITHPDDLARNLDLFQRALAGEIDRYQLEKRFVHKQEHFVWVALNAVAVRDAAGVLLYFVVQIQDITERKRAEELLRASEERFRALIEHAADPVGILDETGVYRYASPAHEYVLGYAPDELHGTSAFALIHPDDVSAAVETFTRLVEQPDATPTLVCRKRHKNGSWRTLVVVGRNFLQHPAIRGIVVNGTDVTERDALEAQLRQSQKMEALGQLAGGIAHDFNNLLTAILANTELLLGDFGDGPVRQDVEMIRQTAERAAGLTRQLLAFGRKQVVQPRLLDLNAVVADTERMLGRTLGTRAKLEADLAPGLGSVLANPGELELVLVNLAVNARDAMPAGGVLTLRTRDEVVDDARARQHKGLAPGAYVTLSVQDTGAGIPLELQGRIFEPFFTTKPVGEGTGLGLSTVYGIVKQWGGYTAVESAPGVGTTFTIYLPRQEGTPRASNGEALPRLPTGTETILIVDDEATVRHSVRRILTRHGYSVLEARNGVEALRTIDQASQRIDLILTDLVMPEMGGRELIATLRAQPVPRKILVMSGYDAQAEMAGEPLPPGTNFLEKPFTVDGLLQALRVALDGGLGSASAAR